jgi:2-polyprenyl-3-methyl-5-hydroxy-6-metoxy-1,4-benzoquinol methylase
MSLVGRARARVITALMRESAAGSGVHLDPEDPATPAPSTQGWTKARRLAQESPAMKAFADTMRPPSGGTVRDGVIGDLAEFYHVPAEQVVHRCLHWEDESLDEWRAAGGDAPGGLAEFYNSVVSWSFDLLWYSYLQTVGFAAPNHVVVADWLPEPAAGARLLDFGSGVGVTAQLFATLGYEVTLADISTSLLDFARWRLERRGVKAEYLQLPADLPPASYDVITALDTLAHVPDAEQTASELYAATRPGGLLVTNFDTRRRSERNAWHLYDDDLPLRWAIERAGFVQLAHIDGDLWVYQARPTTGAAWRRHKLAAWLRLASPPARGLRAVQHGVARAALVALARVRRIDV